MLIVFSMMHSSAQTVSYGVCVCTVSWGCRIFMLCKNNFALLILPLPVCVTLRSSCVWFCHPHSEQLCGTSEQETVNHTHPNVLDQTCLVKQHEDWLILTPFVFTRPLPVKFFLLWSQTVPTVTDKVVMNEFFSQIKKNVV